MHPIEHASGPFTILRAFRLGFSAVLQQPWLFGVIVLLVGIPTEVFESWVDTHTVRTAVIALNFAFGIWYFFIPCLGMTLVQAAVAGEVLARLRGERATLRGCFESAFITTARLLPFIIMAVAPIWALAPIEARLGYRPNIVGETLSSSVLLLVVLLLLLPIAIDESSSMVGLVLKAWRLWRRRLWRGIGAILLTLVTGLLVWAILGFLSFEYLHVGHVDVFLICLASAVVAAPSAAAYQLLLWEKAGTRDLLIAPVFD